MLFLEQHEKSSKLESQIGKSFMYFLHPVPGSLSPFVEAIKILVYQKIYFSKLSKIMINITKLLRVSTLDDRVR